MHPCVSLSWPVIGTEPAGVDGEQALTSTKASRAKTRTKMLEPENGGRACDKTFKTSPVDEVQCSRFCLQTGPEQAKMKRHL
jgi:hypothetical protein